MLSDARFAQCVGIKNVSKLPINTNMYQIVNSHSDRLFDLPIVRIVENQSERNFDKRKSNKS